MARLSVFIADDHVVVRRGLRALLESEADIEVVGEAAEGRGALAEVERLQPDVLVLDLMMPGIGGLEVLKALAGRHVPTRVVVLSMHANEAYVAEALRNGALAYVLKEASATDVLAAVRQVASGQRFLSPPLNEASIEAQLQHPPTSGSTPPDQVLTARERQVLVLAAQGRTNQQIAEELQISRRTAESHRANLLRKLGLKGQQELIRYALRLGILEP